MRAVSVLLPLLTLLSCGSHEWVEGDGPSDGIHIRYEVDRKSQKKDGQEIAHRQDGNIYYLKHYQQGVLHGTSIFFTANGDTSFAETYKQGVFHGLYKNYHSDGSLKLKGYYKEGSMEGQWKKYHPNGQLEEEVLFEDNQENGPFVEYHPNGSLRAQGTYLEGDQEHGLLQLYDTTGVLIRKMECDMGVCKTIWKINQDEQQ